MAYKRKAMRAARRGRAKRRRIGGGRKRVYANVARREIYPFKRFVYRTNIAGDDTIFNGYNVTTFSLGNVPNAGEFVSLFDNYKLAGVAYRWVSRRDPSFATTAANKGQYPLLAWVEDDDDGTVPTTLSQLQERPKFKEFYFSPDCPTTKWFFMKPKWLTVAYETAVLSGYKPSRGFLDCASPDVPHYGIKYAYQGLYLGMTITLECKYYLLMKNVK